MKTFNDLKAGDILYVINFGTSIGGMRLEEHKIIETKPDTVLDNWLEIITVDGKYHIPPSHTSHEQYYFHHTNIESAKKSYIQLAEKELKESKNRIYTLSRALAEEQSIFNFISKNVEEYENSLQNVDSPKK